MQKIEANWHEANTGLLHSKPQCMSVMKRFDGKTQVRLFKLAMYFNEVSLHEVTAVDDFEPIELYCIIYRASTCDAKTNHSGI